MKIIPVIDLKENCVVHAKYGQRNLYQPIQSVLSKTADIYDVLQGFLTLYPFDTFYIADLDAISEQGNHATLIENVLANFPHLIFWIDAGFQKARNYPHNYLPVLGSECFSDKNVHELTNFQKNFVLSLDFGANEEKLGAPIFFTQPELWTKNVIIMTLNRVGSSQGVAIDLLTQFKKNYPQTNFVAAGGVRNEKDLDSLKKMGVNTVLVASALHSGIINLNQMK